MPNRKPTRVAIVGTGLAGLSCARALVAAGIEVSCFDKSRSASGRMATRRGDAGQFDHGAQYFTARDPRFVEAVSQWREAGVVARWTPRLAVFDEAAGPARLDAREPSDSSAGVVERYVGTPTMTAPARHLAADLNVTHGCTVRSLEHGPGGWRLRTDADAARAEDAHFDAVVLALPAPQAAVLLKASVTGAAPSALTALADVARSARMRGCWAVMVGSPEPLDLPFDAAFVNAGPLRWVARDSSKPGRCRHDGREAWLLHASAAWSEANLEREPAEVTAELLAAFAALGARLPGSALPASTLPGSTLPASTSLPGLTAVAHRWRYADTDPALEHRFAWDGGAAVGLCGDWLHGGRVEGAWLSGAALAQAILGH